MLTLEMSITSIPQLAEACEAGGLTPDNCEKIAQFLAAMFSVTKEEVAIMLLEKTQLGFVYPEKLKQVGKIPLNTTTSVAARTATTKRAEALNNFTATKHASVFEAVNLGSAKPKVIQKMMSVPVIGPDGVQGVIQISRKGATPQEAGADFAPSDVQKLFGAAGQLAKCFKLVAA